MMQAVILAGGLATRLRPLTEKISKSMIRIKDKPFLEYQIGLLKKNGISDIVLCVGHLAEQVAAYFGDGRKFGVNLTYSYETERLLGTGGAIRNASGLLRDEFFVIYGDSYLPIDFPKIHERFLSARSDALMVVYRNESKFDRSNVRFEKGMVTLYNKKAPDPHMHYIDYGCTVLTKSLLERIPAGVTYDLADLLADLGREGLLRGYEVHARFFEVGSFEGMSDFEKYLEAHES